MVGEMHLEAQGFFKPSFEQFFGVARLFHGGNLACPSQKTLMFRGILASATLNYYWIVLILQLRKGKSQRMHISAVEEYGLRCALQLASLETGAVLAASQIAEREGISVQYASKIMHLFRKAGLVAASRGMQGGFWLKQPPSEISLKSVFSAVREEKAGFCNQYKGLQEECVHLKECSVRPVWDVLSSYFDSVLDHLTLADLVSSEAESRKRIEIMAKAEANRIKERFSVTQSLGVHL